MVDQRASSTTALGYAGAGNLEIQLDGGLDLKTNPHVLESPKTTAAENALLSNQGVVKQLPGVSTTFDTVVYTAGALPTNEPYVSGAYFQIQENVSIRDSFTTTPLISTQCNTGPITPRPNAPIYPLTIGTRSLVGDAGLNFAAQDTIAQPQPVSAQGLKAGAVDYSRQLVTVQPNSGTGGALVYVTDLNGNTIGQARRTLETSGNYNYLNYSLICDPTTPSKFYFASADPTNGLVVYTITLQALNSTSNDAVSSITKTVVDAGQTSLRKLMLVNYQNTSLLIWADGTNVRSVSCTSAGLVNNVVMVADFNTASLQLAAFVSTNRVFVGIGTRLRIFTTTGTAPNFTYAVQQVVNIDPSSYGIDATTGFYNTSGSAATVTVFGRVPEDYTSGVMSGKGYAATAVRIYQLMAVQVQYDGTNVGTVSSRFFRCEVGSRIASRAFVLKSGTKGMVDSGSTLCAISLGSRYMGGAYFLGGSFLVDHNCQIVARYNDNTGDNGNVMNQASANTFSIARGLSEPYFVSEPNNACMFEMGFPFLSAVITGSNRNYNVPVTGTNLVYSLIPSILGYNINLLNIQYQRQGAVVTPSRCGKALLMNGALSMEHDGRTLHESGFHFQASPPGPPYGTTGSGQPAGTYYYYNVYRWTDAMGQMHQSAPSPARAVTFSAAFGQVYFVTYPPIATYKGLDSATAGAQSTSAVYCDTYRTSTASSDPTATVSYLVNSARIVNKQHIGPDNFLDGNTIASDIDNQTTIKVSAPPLYTNSQIAANAPPSFIYAVNSKGRCFGLAQIGSTYRIYFSSPYSDIPFPFASRWNVNGFVTVPPELGDCRSLAALDDKILVFGTAGVAAFNGDGPSIFDTTGSFNYTDNPTQLNYSAVTPLPMPLGTVGCGAPVTIPNGVLYQDRQGIMLVDRGLGATFVGGAVDALTDTNRYGRPYLHPQFNSVIYPNANGTALVYAFDLQRFSTWPALQNSVGVFQTADGSTFSCGTSLVNGAVATASTIYQVRDANIITQVTPPVMPTLTMETPWQHVGQGFGGEGNIWEALVTGQYYAPHTLQLEMAYDYGPYEAAQSVSYLTGSTTPQAPYQSRFRPPRRARADVIRFRVKVTPEAGSLALECARITGITLYAAAYRGAQRVGSGVQR